MTAAEELAQARAAAVWEIWSSSPAAACVVGELLPGFRFTTGAEGQALVRLADQAGVGIVEAHRVLGELITRGAVVAHHLTGAETGRSVWMVPSIPVALETV